MTFHEFWDSIADGVDDDIYYSIDSVKKVTEMAYRCGAHHIKKTQSNLAGQILNDLNVEKHK